MIVFSQSYENTNCGNGLSCMLGKPSPRALMNMGRDFLAYIHARTDNVFFSDVVPHTLHDEYFPVASQAQDVLDYNNSEHDKDDLTEGHLESGQLQVHTQLYEPGDSDLHDGSRHNHLRIVRSTRSTQFHDFGWNNERFDQPKVCPLGGDPCSDHISGVKNG